MVISKAKQSKAKEVLDKGASRVASALQITHERNLYKMYI